MRSVWLPMACGVTTGPWKPVSAKAQYQACIGRIRISRPRIICERNPTSPNTPYANAARSVHSDIGAMRRVRPMTMAAISDMPAAMACQTAKSGRRAAAGFGRGCRAMPKTWRKKTRSPVTMRQPTDWRPSRAGD